MKSSVGTYALVLESETDFCVQVGKLGRLEGKAGYEPDLCQTALE